MSLSIRFRQLIGGHEPIVSRSSLRLFYAINDDDDDNDVDARMIREERKKR